MNAFIFDMDGVLAENSDYHVEAWTVFSRDYGRELTVEDIKKRLGFNNREYMRFVLDREPTDQEVSDSTVRKEALYREIYGQHLTAPAGLIPLLESLKRDAFACGVATSAPSENVDFVLDGLKIRPYFQRVVDASHVKNCKPDPEIYLEAAGRLNVKPSACVVFEDAIAGVQSAKAAGMTVVAITTSYPAEILREHAPDAIIGSFTDLQAPCAALSVIEAMIGRPFVILS